MCYIMVVKQLDKPSPSVESQIRTVLNEKKDTNDDGFFLKNGSDVIRTLDDRIANQVIKEGTLNNLMAHFRIASVGKVSEDNTHGWTNGDWTFFHNGGISNYSTYQWDKGGKVEQEFSDSFLFFQDLFFELEKSKSQKDKTISHIISALLGKVSFWGRAALYNNVTDKLFLFGDFWVYTFGSTYQIFSSSFLKFDQEFKQTIRGISMVYPNPSIIGEAKIDGIGVISDFSTPDFSYRNLQEKFVTAVRSYNTYPHFDSKEWDHEGGQWKRKLGTPGTRAILVPPMNEEHELMQQNIARNADQYLDDLELDLGGKKFETYTKEQLDDLMLDDEFIGWDNEGNELYQDEYGLHDANRGCCYNSTCRALDNFEGIILKAEMATEKQKEAMGFQMI